MHAKAASVLSARAQGRSPRVRADKNWCSLCMHGTTDLQLDNILQTCWKCQHGRPSNKTLWTKQTTMYPSIPYCQIILIVYECNLLSSLVALPLATQATFTWSDTQLQSVHCMKTHSRSKSQVSSLRGTVSMEYFYNMSDRSFITLHWIY